MAQRRARRFTAFTVALALVVAACSDGDGATTTSTAVPVPIGTTPTPAVADGAAPRLFGLTLSEGQAQRAHPTPRRWSTATSCRTIDSTRSSIGCRSGSTRPTIATRSTGPIAVDAPAAHRRSDRRTVPARRRHARRTVPTGPLHVLRVPARGRRADRAVRGDHLRPADGAGRHGRSGRRPPTCRSPSRRRSTGTWQWIGTRTLRFDARRRRRSIACRWPPTYTVTVPAGTESATGGVLADDVIVHVHHAAADGAVVRHRRATAGARSDLRRHVRPAHRPRRRAGDDAPAGRRRRASPLRLATAAEIEADDDGAQQHARRAEDGRWIAFRAGRSAAHRHGHHRRRSAPARPRPKARPPPTPAPTLTAAAPTRRCACCASPARYGDRVRARQRDRRRVQQPARHRRERRRARSRIAPALAAADRRHARTARSSSAAPHGAHRVRDHDPRFVHRRVRADARRATTPVTIDHRRRPTPSHPAARRHHHARPVRRDASSCRCSPLNHDTAAGARVRRRPGRRSPSYLRLRLRSATTPTTPLPDVDRAVRRRDRRRR